MTLPLPPREPVMFTRKKLAELEAAHKQAHDAQQERFVFQGNEYYTKYAYYLIQYLKGALK